MIRLFDIQNNQVIPTEHCYTLNFLQMVMLEHPENYLKIYAYLYYMCAPDPTNNPFFNVPADEKEAMILEEIDCDFSLEDEIVLAALNKCRKLYETPTQRAYKAIASYLDKMATSLDTEQITYGRDGNAGHLLRYAEKFDQVRQSFKGTLKDLEEEQKGSTRGGARLAYDQM